MVAPTVPESIEIPASHKIALASLSGGAVVGLAAALLIPSGKMGLGVPIMVLVSLGIYSLLVRMSVIRPQTSTNRLWIPIVLFASFLAWRDAPALRFLNSLTLFLFVGVLAIRARSSSIAKGSAYDYPLRALGAWAMAFIDGFNLILNDIVWSLIPKSGHGRHVASIVRGLLLATPLVLIFGVLLSSADANFERLIQDLFRLDAETFFVQFFIGLICFWFSAGLFRRVFLGDAPPITPETPDKPKAMLGGLEIGIVLSALNALFLMFVATQWPYFFGGVQTLQATADLSMAEFARRGFFELVAVTALALPTLLGLHALVDPQNARLRKLYKVMASVLVVLLSLVMLSAALKMKLYMETFNLSTLRIYVSAALIWLGLVFVWFALTTLRERANYFAWGGIVLFATVVFGLNILNPDATVARLNLRTSDQKDVDWRYLASLSSDAIPVLTKAWDRVPKDYRGEIANRLIKDTDGVFDWRASNLSQINAMKRAALMGEDIRSEAHNWQAANESYP